MFRIIRNELEDRAINLDKLAAFYYGGSHEFAAELYVIVLKLKWICSGQRMEGQMKKLVRVLGAIILLWAFTGAVNASLIGDTVYVEQYHPYPNTASDDYQSISTVVAEGDSDIVTLGRYSVDIEKDFLTVSFNHGDTFSVFDFNGLVISDMQDSRDGYYLLNVAVETDIAGWDDSRIYFGDDFAAFNWAGLSFSNTTEFTATLEFVPVPMPIPTTMVLFITGLLGFAVVRRKN